MSLQSIELTEKLRRFDERCADKNPHLIPPTTNPYWDQPDRSMILVDELHALMSTATFYGLKEYSGTTPTGAFEGKMWRRHDGLFDRSFRARGGRPVWMLCWYGPSERHGYVSTNCRLILLSDGELPGVPA
jgi:hypothetical protein